MTAERMQPVAQGKQESEQNTPRQEMPPLPVPYSADGKGDHDREEIDPVFGFQEQVPVLFHPFREKESQGKEQIVAEPGGKGDMPPVPEIFDRSSEIRLPEITGEPDPEDLRRTQCDIGISREIGIDLKSKKNRGDHQGGPIVMFTVAVHGIDIDGQPVGHYQFFKVSPKHQLQPTGHQVVIESMNFPELGKQDFRPVNGPLGNTREEEKVERKISRMHFRVDGLSLYFDEVTDHRKHQVRQSQREDHPGNGIHAVEPVDKPEIDLQAGEKEAEIFEKSQYQEVEHNQRGEGHFSIALFGHRLQPPAPEVIPCNHQRHQAEKHRDERKVIRNTRHQQPDPPVFSRKKVVYNRNKRQK